MTRLVIAVKSCQRDRDLGFHQAIRDTWGTINNGVPVRFFMGNGTYQYLEGDETILACPDDYRNLPFKTRAIATWFLQTGLEKMFLCDNDTYIDMKAFMALPWQDVDYGGTFSFWPTGAKMGTTFRYEDGQGNTIDPCHAWASGGYGYFLSRKAANLVSQMQPVSWAEDLSVGQVLGPKIQSGELVGRELNCRNKAVWHIEKSADRPVIPQRVYEYHRGIRY